MNLSEYAAATSRPYKSLLREVSILGKLFSSKQLAFNMQAQTETNWCWAATATSVSHFYWFLSNWTQCKVANGELGLTNCCNASVPAACNVPWYLDKALTRTNNYVSMMSGQATFQKVKDEIDAGRPVGARIGWSGSGGHFMVIYGYSRIATVEYFDIDDPIYGKSHLTVNDFATNYQGSGSWTHTYFTKRYFKMPFRDFILVEKILQRIWEERPLLKIKEGMGYAREIREEDDNAALGLAHRVYSLGLDALSAKRTAKSTVMEPQPVSVRVYELVQGTPRAFYDVTEGDQPRILQMSAASSHLEPFARGLAMALSLTSKDDQEAELRMLRVPALNFEALWISYGTEAKDVLLPLRTVGKLTPERPVPMAEAMEALREAARPLAKMDDEMGA